MAVKYTSDKAPNMAVVVASGGVYVHLPDGVVNVKPKKPVVVEQLVLDQFQVMNSGITWDDIDCDAAS